MGTQCKQLNFLKGGKTRENTGNPVVIKAGKFPKKL